MTLWLKNQNLALQKHAKAKIHCALHHLVLLQKVFKNLQNKNVFLLLLMGFFSGCADEIPVPQGVQKSISIEFTAKESCQPVVNYSLECLSAVMMRLIPVSGGEVIERCVELSTEDRPENLFNFMTGDDVLRFFRVTKGKWTLQIRGIHDTAASDNFKACEARTDVGSWLFWGETPAPIDLDAFATSDAGILNMNLRIECRDCSFGCATLGDALCPAPMPPAFCVPSDSQFTCARTCQEKQSCFEGALKCEFNNPNTENGRCNPAGGNPETSAPTFCAPCETAADCADGYFCVGLEDNRFCAQDCPASLCAKGATCNRLGAGLLQF